MNKKGAFSHAHYLPRQYAKNLLIIEKGTQFELSDVSGKSYLDFAAGIAVNAFGYGHKDIAALLAKQAEKLIHVSNLFTTEATLEMAEKLCTSSPLPEDQPWVEGKNPAYFSAVHFGNSGTEANEAAIKYARAWQQRKNRKAWKILAFENSFHGRTMGALSLTWPEKYRKPFAPLVPGATFARLNDPKDLRKKLTRSFAAVIVEPVQGEGGLHAMSPHFARELNRLCQERNILLIADEVQTGLGRCGTLYASEAIGLKPDIITLSKPLAAGLPLSATLIKSELNDILQTGDHASTFGGGPLTCTLAAFVWDTINKAKFLEDLRTRAAYFEERLCAIRDSFPNIFSSEELRGRGMLKGIIVKNPEHIATIISRAMDAGLLILRSGNDVLRFAPPLTIAKKHIDKMEKILRSVIGGIA